MASKIDIFNLALTKLGAKRATSPTETGNATHVNAVWDAILEEVLATFPWNFATRRVSLARLSTTPTYGYDYQFRIPAQPKSLRIWEAVPDTENPTKLYVIEGDAEGGLLLTNFNAIDIKHTVLILDTERYNPLFREVLALRLASEVAYAVTGKLRLRAYYEELYAAKIEIAAMIDAQQGEDYMADDSKHPSNDDWVDGRHGGATTRIIGEVS